MAVEASGPDRDRPLLGLAYRLGGAATLSLVLMLVKLAKQEDIALIPLLFFRQFVPLAMLCLWLGMRGSFGSVRTARFRGHAGRCIPGFVGLFLIASGVQLLPLAEATIYGFTAPIFAVLFAATILRETVGWVRWFAVVIGLVGVIVMVGGGGGHANLIGVACSVGGAVCVAAVAIQLRSLATTESPLTIVFWYFLITTVLLLVLLIPMLPALLTYDLWQWTILIGAGVGTLAIQFLQTASVRYGNVSSVIVMDYSSLAWSALWGWLIFADVLPGQTWLGAPLIMAAGALIIYREARVGKRRAARALEGG